MLKWKCNRRTTGKGEQKRGWGAVSFFFFFFFLMISKKELYSQGYFKHEKHKANHKITKKRIK